MNEADIQTSRRLDAANHLKEASETFEIARRLTLQNKVKDARHCITAAQSAANKAFKLLSEIET